MSMLTQILSELAELRRSIGSPATKCDLQEMEKRIIMKVQDAIDALTNLSTAADGLSTKVDKLVTDTTGLITELGSTDLTPDQEAAVAKAQASATAAAAEGAKVDAAVAAADQVLPTPAPAA